MDQHIQAGIDAADAGAIVAVAAGTYAEDLDIESKPVRVWGKCPGQVEVQGTGADWATIDILGHWADGSEVRDIAITGAALGILVFGSGQVVLDRLWVHDTSGRGVSIEHYYGSTNALLTGTLIEATHDIGAFVYGAEATIEATEVRETQTKLGGTFGRGFHIQAHNETGKRADVALRSSVAEKNHELGIFVAKAEVAIEAMVVRETQPNQDGDFGRGIVVQDQANVVVDSSLIEKNHNCHRRCRSRRISREADGGQHRHLGGPLSTGSRWTWVRAEAREIGPTGAGVSCSLTSDSRHTETDHRP